MAGPNQLYDFGRVHHKGQFCDFFCKFWTIGSGGEVIQRHFLSGALADPLFNGVEPFVQNWWKTPWVTNL